ncbi:MAG: cyanophycin synthetase [Halanaerobiaceae bacterium]|nr:cyanophycin synthetase [Halanaerobiaceae bacterium]
MKILSYRFLSGVNVYAYSPVLEVEIDLEKYDQVESRDVPGFNESLLAYYPGLAEHGCSYGFKGGFLQRLREGTYFSHIIEHLCLEIQAGLGQDVYYGKSIWQKGSCYKIIVEYQVEEIGLFAFRAAFRIVKELLLKKEIGFTVRMLEREGERVLCKYGIGPSTAALLKAARERDIPVIPLDRVASLYQLGYGRKQKRIEATIASTTSCIAVDIACNKIQTRALLQEAGIPVPRGFVVEKITQLREIIHRLGTPLAVKPYNSNHGKGVSLNINNWPDLKEAFQQAREYSKKVLVEEYVEGKDYRLLVVGGKMVAAAERIPPHVIGDGKSSIRELIDIINSSPVRGKGHEKNLTCIRLDGMVEKCLQEQGLDLDRVPEKGQVVFLRYNGNLSTGGTARDVTGEVHPDNARLAARAARIIGLDIAGVDLVARDIRVPISQQQGAIIEVNAAPGIRMHHYPQQGESRNAAGAIIDYLFPDDDGRIPVIAVTGTNGKTSTCRLLAKIFREVYENVGLTISEGTYINDTCIGTGDNTGPVSARTLLKEPVVDIAVLETARGGIWRAGLGYDKSDIGIILNITEDHLGVDGIESLEELADLKSLVIETVKKEGACILNAEDPLAASLARRASAPVVYFSIKANNLLLESHCQLGGKAVYLEGNTLVYQEGPYKRFILEDVREVPFTFKGLAVHNLENILAATAAALCSGVEAEIIRKALLSFGSSRNDNPGRLNLFEGTGLKVILDYGHNPVGFREVFKFMKKLGGKRLAGVVGVPGDRKDDLIIRAGEICGRYLDLVYIKEDRDLRGRKAGEVAALIEKGLVKSGFTGFYSFIADEQEALREALANALPGDIIVCFYEREPEKLVQIIQQGIIEFETREAFREQGQEELYLLKG